MAATNINRVVLTGNLTRDPELRTTPSGNCATYLQKGRPVAVDGRLEWREWEDQNGNKRQAVDIIADSVQFLGSRDASENGGRFTPQSDVPADTGDFQQAPAATGSSDDDIPF